MACRAGFPLKWGQEGEWEILFQEVKNDGETAINPTGVLLNRRAEGGHGLEEEGSQSNWENLQEKASHAIAWV